MMAGAVSLLQEGQGGARMKSLIRQSLRWYLARSPVTEGKGWLYRTFSKALLPEEWEVVACLPAGFRMALDLSEAAQREIFFFGSYERKESALIRGILRAGDTFWDIGANIGYYTLLGAACVGPTGRVLAFEPFPPAWERLQRNVRLNSFGQIRCVNAAVTSAAGRAPLFFHRYVADGVAHLAALDRRMSSVTCDTVTLDRFRSECNEPPPIMMKVDVEGAEKAVLMGGRGILSSATPPMLLVEMEDEHFANFGTSSAEIQDLLSPLGFTAYHLQGRRWLHCRDLCHARSRNVFWANPSSETHRARMRAAGIEDVHVT